MRFTNYSKYTGHLADALNLQSLLDQLSDFLLQRLRGRALPAPYWASGDEEGDFA